MMAAMAVAVAVCWLASTTCGPASRQVRGRPPRRWPRGALGAAAAVTIVGALGPAGIILLVAGCVGARWRTIAARRATRRAQRAALADAVEMIVLAVGAGHAPANAVRAVRDNVPAALADAFAAVVDRLDRGVRFADALGALREHLGEPADPLIDVLGAADRYGLPLAPALDRLAAEARLARRQQAEAAARELPVRLAAPLVLCTLPSFVLLAIVPLLIGTLSSLRR
jgi:tight adherence protein C